MFDQTSFRTSAARHHVGLLGLGVYIGGVIFFGLFFFWALASLLS